MINNEALLDFGQIEDRSKGIIKVIGVGGGGCNAVRNMYNEDIQGVTLAVCNTDSKSLAPSPVPRKIMLGEGLGAGGDPAVGRSEAEKNIDDIRQLLSDGTKMVFVTASMGGGTGTAMGRASGEKRVELEFKQMADYRQELRNYYIAAAAHPDFSVELCCHDTRQQSL
jgi:hypothetical protein